MEIQLSTMLFLFLSTTVLLASTTFGQPIEPSSNETDYIRTSCNITRYPETCFATLSNYSDYIQHDPGRMAKVAIHVALSNVTHTANYVTNISQLADANNNNTRESAAIEDCVSVLGDAIDEIHNSNRQMKHLGNWSRELIRFELSNVQTWMSAALTNEETCTDGFDEVVDSDMKADVCARVDAVKEVTSNALALVNSYADTVSA
ncbi:Pectinesterase inhibitor [Artemisia annua]|uniref:pectinesterase n=1 Tax=Artemisia annua TaxID=35608 RepID=A0A2U1LA30_ARTAN|nr:Pectinesterase inhibitor [Artemisia annua]